MICLAPMYKDIPKIILGITFFYKWRREGEQKELKGEREGKIRMLFLLFPLMWTRSIFDYFNVFFESDVSQRIPKKNGLLFIHIWIVCYGS
jgi:hypothetical protein